MTERGRGRNAQLERVLRIVQDLSRLDGSDVYELAERYGAAVRTIRRDLEALDRLGYLADPEAAPDGSRKVRWKLAARGDGLGKLSALLDASHYLALRVAMGEAGALAQDSSLYAALEDLAAKIEGAVGKKGRRQLAAIERCFLPWDKHAYRSAGREHLWPLVRAIEDRRICRVAYRAVSTGGKLREYEVLPLKLFTHDRALYLVCKFEGHRGLGTLNLHRMEHVTRTDRRGEPPPDLDPAAWAESAFTLHPGGRPTRYLLRFASEVAPYIRERTWHPSQTLRDLPDGGVELRFTCGESHEVTSWVAGWREWVEVVGPVRLREELKKLGAALARRYAAGQSRGKQSSARAATGRCKA